MKNAAKKIITTAIITAMVLLLQAAVYAETTFKDIKNHWAEKQIKEMVADKMILGYPDGTFKPDNPVTKLDTLIMASRVLGVDKSENSEEAITAQDTYKSMLSTYNIYGKREISFLLHRKIFSQSEIDAYIKGENAKLNTKRYEAAIVFTKIMGKENDVKNKTFVILPFMDSQQIPLNAKPYVEFMNDQDIMKGMTSKEFRPNDTLTRAQAAVILLKVNNKLGSTGAQNPAATESTFTGTIDFINRGTMLVIVKSSDSSKSFTLLSTTPVKVDNASSSFENLERGFNASVKTKGTEIISLEATSRTYAKTFNGIVSSIATTPSIKIGIKDSMDENAVTETYGTDDYIQITKNGSNTTIDAVDTGDFGSIYLTSSNKIGKLVIEDKNRKISGTVEDITTGDKVYLSIKEDNKETKKYEVVSDVEVSRNNSTSTLKDVKAGDDVEVTLEYNKIKKIKAESDQKTIEGTIEEIFISKDSKLAIKVGTKINTYLLSPNAVIKVDGTVSTIYDLKLGVKGKFELDSNIITLIKAEKKVETVEVRGTIKLINLSLGLITVEGDDSVTTQIYVTSSDTKVNNIEDSDTMKLSELKENQKIIAYGKNDRGVFVTSLIVVTSGQ